MRTPEQIILDILKQYEDRRSWVGFPEHGIMTSVIVRTLRAEGWLDESQRKIGEE